MACHFPKSGFRYSDGTMGFSPVKPGHPVVAKASFRCHRCAGCREDYSRDWTVRLCHEARMHEVSCMVTLTYSDEELKSLSLCQEDVQLFLKRLRIRLFREWIEAGKPGAKPSIRYFAGAEYGSNTKRPHFHVLIFGWVPTDGVEFCRTDAGVRMKSALLDDVWSKGFTEWCFFSSACAGYVARYCLKKVNGSEAGDHYTVLDLNGEVVVVEPEFSLMSTRPGIGKSWFDKYWRTDALWLDGKRDGVLLGGVEVPLPAYYNKLARRQIGDKAYERIVDGRLLKAKAQAWNRTPPRLQVRAECHEAKHRERKRGL